MARTEDQGYLVKDTLSELTKTELELHRLALEEGKTDEVCPREGCSRVFLAHRDTVAVTHCEHKTYFYSLSELERKTVVASSRSTAEEPPKFI